MNILIDNGHGVETPGKRSPDGRLREYAYTRMIADRVVEELRLAGLDARRIVPEEADVPLSERVARVNKIYDQTQKQALLVSIHCNAAGDGSQWLNARGWSVFVDPTAGEKSKQLATQLAQVAKTKNITLRQPDPRTPYWASSLYICKNSRCPAVLIENFFQDNRQDVDYLLSEQGMACVTDITVQGVQNYLNNQ